jgi:hypothetical protein
VRTAILGIALLLIALPCPAHGQAFKSSTNSYSEADFNTATKQVQTSRAALLGLPIGNGMQT